MKARKPLKRRIKTTEKEQVQVYLEKNILTRVDKLVVQTTKYANRSHFLNIAAERLLKKGKK